MIAGPVTVNIVFIRDAVTIRVSVVGAHDGVNQISNVILVNRIITVQIESGIRIGAIDRIPQQVDVRGIHYLIAVEVAGFGNGGKKKGADLAFRVDSVSDNPAVVVDRCSIL